MAREKKADFKVTIDQVKVEEIHKQLQNAINQQSVDSELVNCIASEISSLFQNSASKCLKKSNVVKHKKSDKPWFGYKCRSARKKYLSARKRYNVRPSSGNKAHLTNMSKSYKKILNLFINDHKNKTQNKLRHLHSGQPKQFWKLIHNLETKKVDDKIKIEELYEYFKNLNSDEPNDDNEPQLHLNDQNDTLDAPITEQQIRLNLKKLHNNKSPSLR